MSQIVPYMRTRDDLFNYIARECRLPTFRRCLEDAGAKIINLGAFDPLPGYGRPGWIVKFVTKFGVTRYLAVPATRAWMWEVRDKEIHWDYYVGSKVGNPLYIGDLTDEQREAEANKTK